MEQGTGAPPTRWLLLGGLAAVSAPAARAADAPWPSRPIAVLMPLQAGSASDVATRLLADRLGELPGQRLIVENVTGAAGLIGAERAARAPADGHTLAALNNSILTILPNLQRRRLGFDPFADFAPVGGIATIPTFLGVHRDVPPRTVAELVALAQTRELSCAAGGAGSPQHLATEMFMALTGVRMAEVAYRGAAQSAADLAAGYVQVMFVAQALELPLRDAGTIRFVGFAGTERHPDHPDLPTLAEQGVAGFDYSSWIALFAPAGVPAGPLARLREACAAAMAEEGLRARLARAVLAPWDRAPDALAATMREDDARWRAVVRAADIRI